MIDQNISPPHRKGESLREKEEEEVENKDAGEECFVSKYQTVSYWKK